MTTKLKQLQNLANTFPGQQKNQLNASLSKGDAALQQAVGQAPTQGLDITKAAQGIGASMAGAQVQDAAQAQQQQGAMNQQVGQLGMQATNIESSKKLANMAFKVDEDVRKQADALAKLDNNYKNQLLDNQLNFNKDKRGQYILKQRQMFDLAALKARDANEFNQYARQAMKANQRYLMMMETAHKKVMREYQQQWQIAEQDKDQDLKKKLAVRIREHEAAMERAKARAANRMAAWKTGGIVVGTVAGAVVGSMLAPGAGTAYGASAGAAAGGSLGGGLGTAVGSQQ